MRIHDFHHEQLLGTDHDIDTLLCCVANSAACAPLPAPAQLEAPSLPSSSSSTRTNTASRARWQQLRRLIGQLTRGMRAHVLQPPRNPSSNAMDNDNHDSDNFDNPLLRDVVPGASMLHRDFWLEALDQQHRYGFHLRAFHRVWKDSVVAAAASASGAINIPSGDIVANGSIAVDDPRNASFFYWLDHGAGRTLELPECTRFALESQRVEYCDALTRRAYAVEFVSFPDNSDCATTNGVVPLQREPVLVYTATRSLVQTDERSKWIFVLALDGRFYVGRKRKGAFHHSSFVAGAPILAAGKLMVKLGRIVAIEPHSGHFKPTLHNLAALCRVLRAANVDVTRIAFVPPKKWTSAWPFVDQLPARLAGCELEDLESDTDYYYGSYKSDMDEP